MKILVVDDEALLVKGIRFNLQNEGYEVITGSDGLDAVRAVQEQSPDLVVLDVMMPNMDGLTACAKIREFSDIPIIMLTAKTDDMDKLMGFDHGADDYLTKPFNILELKARIRALLRRANTSEKKTVGNTLTIGNITLDLDARNAYHSGQIADLTAKTDDMDKLMGFDHGADDYITKPFNILELKARIRALLRRSGSTEKKVSGNLLSAGTISLDLDARNAYRSGEMVDLTAKEFDVIEFLMRNPNRVYSREALLDTIWAYEYRSDIRTVDVHIRRLREKLEENPAEPKYILTKWGVGYYYRK